MKTSLPLGKSLLVFGAFLFTGLAVYAAISLPNGFLRSTPYHAIDTASDQALTNAVPKAIDVLDSIVSHVKDRANTHLGNEGNSGYNAYLDRYLAAVDSLDNSLKSEKDYSTTYVYIFKYLYPRVEALKKGDATDVLSKLKQTITSVDTPDSPTISTGSVKTTNFTIDTPAEFAGTYATMDDLCAKVGPFLTSHNLGWHGSTLNGESICAPAEVGPSLALTSPDYKKNTLPTVCTNGATNFPACTLATGSWATTGSGTVSLRCDSSRTRASLNQNGWETLTVGEGEAKAYAWTAPSADYQYGVQVTLFNGNRGYDVTVSKNPCDFSSNIAPLCSGIGSEVVLNTMTDDAIQRYVNNGDTRPKSSCHLIAGATYYVNIKSGDGGGGTFLLH